MDMTVTWSLVGAALICAGAFLTWGLGPALMAAGVVVIVVVLVVVN